MQLCHVHPEALHKLYLRHAGVTYRLCLRMLGSLHDAGEDAASLRLQAQSGRYDAGVPIPRCRAAQVQGGLPADDPFDLVAPPPMRDPLDRGIIEAALRERPELDQVLLEAAPGSRRCDRIWGWAQSVAPSSAFQSRSQ